MTQVCEISDFCRDRPTKELLSTQLKYFQSGQQTKLGRYALAVLDGTRLAIAVGTHRCRREINLSNLSITTRHSSQLTLVVLHVSPVLIRGSPEATNRVDVQHPQDLSRRKHTVTVEIAMNEFHALTSRPAQYFRPWRSFRFALGRRRTRTTRRVESRMTIRTKGPWTTQDGVTSKLSVQHVCRRNSVAAEHGRNRSRDQVRGEVEPKVPIHVNHLVRKSSTEPVAGHVDCIQALHFTKLCVDCPSQCIVRQIQPVAKCEKPPALPTTSGSIVTYTSSVFLVP